VGAVTVVVLVDIVLGNGLAPLGATRELFVMNVDASIDNVDIDTLATERLVVVFAVSAKSQAGAVADAGETLARLRISNPPVTRG
jgi:hypothetical protein